MLPGKRTCKNKVEVQSWISSQHATIGSDQAGKIFARLDRAMMKDIRSGETQAQPQFLQQVLLWRRTIKNSAVAAFINNMNFRFRDTTKANYVFPGVFRDGDNRG